MGWRWRAILVAAALVVALSAYGAIGTGQSHQTKLPARFYGMNLGKVPSKSEADHVAKAGATFARFPFDWRGLQPSRHGGFNWTYTDKLVDHLAQAGLETVPVLYASPGWLKKNYRRPPIKPKGARSAWRKFLRAAVDRYGPSGSFWTLHPLLPYLPIHYWQVWNEPNLPGFFAPKASPKKYAKLLHISAAAIRSASPKVKVLLAGLPQTPNRKGQMLSWVFLRKLYNAGAKGEFDAIAVHPFAYDIPGVANQLKRLRKVTRGHGQGHIPMWIDEIGWSSSRKKSNPFAAGPNGQARDLRHVFHYVLAHRSRLHIARLEWVLYRDRAQTPGCIFCHSGLVKRSGHAKPALSSYRRFAKR